MDKAQNSLETFLQSILDSKLTGMPTSVRSIYKDADFRLDMQQMTRGGPAKHNLQVQVNRGTGISTLKKMAP